MGNEKNVFDSYVINGILASNEFGITQVLNLTSIKSLYYSLTTYQQITDLIRAKNRSAIESLEANAAGINEFLDIMSFTDQDGKKYIVTVYDSLELTQNPQVIDIFLQ